MRSRSRTTADRLPGQTAPDAPHPCTSPPRPSGRGPDGSFAQDDLSWVVNSYTLVFGGFLLLGGRLADLLGGRRLFVAGLILFSIAFLAGGLATSDLQLVVARAFQGLGAALVSPAALSIVTTTFAEGAERNKALGVWGAVAGAGGAAGVLLGGVLTEYLGWEWVLWGNVPVGIAAAALALRLLPDSRDEHEERSFALPGAFAVTAGLAILVDAVVDAERAGWGSLQTIGLGALALGLIAGFLLIESRARKPLVPLSTFRLRTLRGANVVGLLVGMSLFSMGYFVSVHLQQVLGFDALEAGSSRPRRRVRRGRRPRFDDRAGDGRAPPSGAGGSARGARLPAAGQQEQLVLPVIALLIARVRGGWEPGVPSLDRVGSLVVNVLLAAAGLVFEVANIAPLGTLVACR